MKEFAVLYCNKISMREKPYKCLISSVFKVTLSDFSAY